MSGQRIHTGVVCKCEVCGVDFHPPKSSLDPGLVVRPGLGRFCSHKCSGVGRRGCRVPLRERFWAKVNKDGPPPAELQMGNCWLWTAGKNVGYGTIGVGNPSKPMLAHRLSYEWEYGPIPDDLIVRHRCDVRACVRPSHLCLGTAVENALDWVERGASPPPVERPRTPQDRFWAKVSKEGPVPTHCPDIGPCWLWTGAKDSRGYGKVGIGGGKKTVPAHRLLWEWEHGPIQAGLFLLHRCDNPSCVRPDHLLPGNAADNIRDCVVKGRKNPHTKLTADQVREIRRRCAAGESQCSVARLFSLCQPTVHGIVHRKLWAHID